MTSSLQQPWPVEVADGRGRSHGTSSAVPFDRWFRYPAGFASDYVELLVKRLDIKEGVLVDCFMGSGVTGTAALNAGLSFSGIEAHPLIAELATLKLKLVLDSDSLRAAAKDVAAIRPREVKVDEETELVRRSFDRETLETLVGIRQAIRDRPDEALTVALKWALLATLRDVADVKVGWPYQRPSVPRRPRHRDARSRFIARAALMADDIDLPRVGSLQTSIVMGDSADENSWASLPMADGCVTSPPYLNNFDYADATRLELYFWGEVRTWKEMCDVVRKNMIVATTQQSSKPSKDKAVEALEAWEGEAGKEVIALTDALRSAQVARGGRTKEYDQVLPAYFVTMRRILTNLAGRLRPGAEAVWLVGDSAPYGVYVDTPALIGRLASESGFDFIEDVSLRERGQRWAKERDRKLSERLIVLKRS